MLSQECGSVDEGFVAFTASFRHGLKGDSLKNAKAADRIVFYGVRYYVEQYLAKAGKMAKLPLAVKYLGPLERNHSVPPVCVFAAPDASVVRPGHAVFRVVARKSHVAWARYVVAMLSMSWYPSAVATFCRRVRDAVLEAYVKSVDTGAGARAMSDAVGKSLRDFGMRGCSSVEQNIIGGCAHLLSFVGTSTLPAAFTVQYTYNNKVPASAGIPSTEHSVIMAWDKEADAMKHAVRQHAQTGVLSCVMDTYDYEAALQSILPQLKAITTPQEDTAKGKLVIRPDSGDPVATVLAALRAADRVFGSRVNSKGYKVLNRSGVLQGDGVDYDALMAILHATMEAGYAADCVAFGMGASLLQKVDDSMLSLCWREETQDCLTDDRPCPLLSLVYDALCVRSPTHRSDNNETTTVVTAQWEQFEALRERLKREWAANVKAS